MVAQEILRQGLQDRQVGRKASHCYILVVKSVCYVNVDRRWSVRAVNETTYSELERHWSWERVSDMGDFPSFFTPCSFAPPPHRWELMELCLCTFAPSDELENFLGKFIQQAGRRECLFKLTSVTSVITQHTQVPALEKVMTVTDEAFSSLVHIADTCSSKTRDRGPG